MKDKKTMAQWIKRILLGPDPELDAETTQALNVIDLFKEKAEEFDRTQEVTSDIVEAAMADVEALDPEPEPSNNHG